MSVTTETRFEVIEKTKNKIVERDEMDIETSGDDAKKLLNEAAKEVASIQNKTVGTVYSQCSRELGLKILEFKELVVKELLGDSDELLNKMIDKRKKIRGNDSISDIKSRMKTICGR
jgi:hypothetical protein